MVSSISTMRLTLGYVSTMMPINMALYCICLLYTSEIDNTPQADIGFDAPHIQVFEIAASVRVGLEIYTVTAKMCIRDRGMLPKNKLGAKLLGNMYVYAGSEHKHDAQNQKMIDINVLK